MSRLGKTFGKIVRSQRKVETSEKDRTSEEQTSRIYLKAFPLRRLSDLEIIKREVESGNVLIVKISPLASKSVEDVKTAVNELCDFVKLVNGDIARLGEERIVVTPTNVRVWREKPIQPEDEVPTAA
ncbi:MAG: cell division protein SepF [Candidatus Bathyarchaeota archaeon]|nr:cell division protein SepF [Candidatus Bathyarchaeota archaeon]